jgi:nucleoside-diphosphate-sugar epimerase
VARILLTGASGFVGRETLTALCATEHEVISAGRKLPTGAWPTRWHGLDLTDRHAVDALMREIRPEIVLHLAWDVEHGKFWTSPANLDSLGASLNVLRAAAHAGLRRFVGIGTCFEYVWPAEGACDERSTPIGPNTVYATAKDAMRRVAESFCREAAISFAWGRLFHLAGPAEQPGRFVPAVTNHLLRGEPAPISNGALVRDFMDVRDAGQGLARLALSEVEGPVNVATGRPVTLAEIANGIAGLLGRPDLLRFGALPERAGEPPRIVASVERLRREVGFEPAHSLDATLRDCVAYWRAR